MQLLDNRQNGPRLTVSTPQAEVEQAARESDTLILEFEAFRDGRGFSLAAILRATGYQGRLIASGKVLPDQVRHLRRSGFDAVELAEGADPEPWQRLNTVFSAAYQGGSHDRQVWHERQAKRAASQDLQALADRLNDTYADANAEDIIAAVLDPALGRSVVAVSSFGAEAAVLLHLISTVKADLPIVFLDTGQHFLQTLSYRKQLTQKLGLSDVRDIHPDAASLARQDPANDLYKTDADACCDLRKVQPQNLATAGFNTRITGRKRFQNAERAHLKPFEAVDGELIVNPLATWTAEQIEDWFVKNQLPRHPLVENGYPSIGCWPCTRAVEPDEDPRGGRWAGKEKTECGIHRRAQLSPAG